MFVGASPVSLHRVSVMHLVLVRPDQHVAWRADAEPVTCTI
jgi:hypothetical protein